MLLLVYMITHDQTRVISNSIMLNGAKYSKMIKNKLLVLLADKEMTMKDLADATQIRYATLWAFARGRTQKADYAMMDKICETLNCTPGDILKHIPNTETEE